MIAGESPASKMQMLVTVLRPTMCGMFAVAMIAMAMPFMNMNTGYRDLMLMLYAYHHAGDNQRQPKQD